MQFHVNFLLVPLLIPLVIAGKTFLDHQDFKMAFEALFDKKTIILTIVAIVLIAILQLAMATH